MTWHVEGAWKLAARAALGAEFMVLEPARGRLAGGGYALTEEQDERLLTALTRLRLAARARLALDAVGGPGVLFWHRTDTFFSSRIGPPTLQTSTRSGRNLSLVTGLDGSVHLGSHMSIVGGGRLVWLGRERLSESSASQDSSQEPSTRMLITAGVRATW